MFWGRRRRARLNSKIIATILVIALSVHSTSVIFSGEQNKYVPSELYSSEGVWVEKRTLTFARRWKNHKLRNVILYSCFATRVVPVLESLVRNILNCPEALYHTRYNELFQVPRYCVNHDCLSKYGKSHFVYASFVLSTFEKVTATTIRPAKTTRDGNIAVMVEPRIHPLYEYTVKQVMSTLGPDWSLQLFVSSENEAHVRLLFEVFPGGGGENIIICNLDQFGLGEMAISGNRMQSAFSVHEELYNSIRGEHILWFQIDVVLRKSPSPEWLKFAYVGSEWRGCEYPCDMSSCKRICHGGNSGLSLRRRSKLKLIATKGHLPEDLWGTTQHRSIMDAKNSFFVDDELHNNSSSRWFEDDLQISFKLRVLDLLPPGHIPPRFAVGETLPTEDVEVVQPSGLHKTWLVPEILPVQIIGLLQLPYERIIESVAQN